MQYKNVINEIHDIWVDSNYSNDYLRSVIQEAELLAKNKEYESESLIKLLRNIRKYL